MKIVDSKPVKQGVNSTMIIPPLVFLAKTISIVTLIIMVFFSTLSITSVRKECRHAECSVFDAMLNVVA
jgi:hypothetical protein